MKGGAGQGRVVQEGWGVHEGVGGSRTPPPSWQCRVLVTTEEKCSCKLAGAGAKLTEKGDAGEGQGGVGAGVP